jgi:AbrB family looped-hinge helix DNA binding protein
METAIVSAKGWVVIPIEYRRKYGIKPGDQVQVVDYGGVLSLIPVSSDPIREAAGMLRGGPSLTKALLREHAKEQERER